MTSVNLGRSELGKKSNEIRLRSVNADILQLKNTLFSSPHVCLYTKNCWLVNLIYPIVATKFQHQNGILFCLQNYGVLLLPGAIFYLNVKQSFFSM